LTVSCGQSIEVSREAEVHDLEALLKAFNEEFSAAGFPRVEAADAVRSGPEDRQRIGDLRVSGPHAAKRRGSSPGTL
jgi:hypothetical protein